jgi:hypothetical protein
MKESTRLGLLGLGFFEVCSLLMCKSLLESLWRPSYFFVYTEPEWIKTCLKFGWISSGKAAALHREEAARDAQA